MTERPTKRLRVQEPISDELEHSECYRIKAELCWKGKNHFERARGLFRIDTGCIGPILNQDLAAKHQIPVHKIELPIDILNAHGEIIPAAGEYYTHRLDMVIGKHEETLR
jgi:hypothetical protein